MERTSSQNWFWPEWPCSWIRAAQFSRSDRPKRGNLESRGGKNVRARIGRFHLNRSEPVLFGRPEQTNEKRPEFQISFKNREIGHLLQLFTMEFLRFSRPNLLNEMYKESCHEHLADFNKHYLATVYRFDCEYELDHDNS